MFQEKKETAIVPQAEVSVGGAKFLGLFTAQQHRDGHRWHTPLQFRGLVNWRVTVLSKGGAPKLGSHFPAQESCWSTPPCMASSSSSSRIASRCAAAARLRSGFCLTKCLHELAGPPIRPSPDAVLALATEAAAVDRQHGSRPPTAHYVGIERHGRHGAPQDAPGSLEAEQQKQ